MSSLDCARDDPDEIAEAASHGASKRDCRAALAMTEVHEAKTEVRNKTGRFGRRNIVAAMAILGTLIVWFGIINVKERI